MTRAQMGRLATEFAARMRDEYRLEAVVLLVPEPDVGVEEIVIGMNVPLVEARNMLEQGLDVSGFKEFTLEEPS